MIKKLFLAVFPRADELTALVVAVTFYSMFLYVDSLQHGLIVFWQALPEIFLESIRNSDHVVEAILTVLGMTLVLLMLLGYAVVPLFSPFIRFDTRGLAAFILLVDAGILIAVNVHWYEGQLYRRLIIGYLIAWLLYTCVALRSLAIDMVMARYRSPATPSITMGVIASLLAGVGYGLFDLWWGDAYMLATLITLVFTRFISNLEEQGLLKPWLTNMRADAQLQSFK